MATRAVSGPGTGRARVGRGVCWRHGWGLILAVGTHVLVPAPNLAAQSLAEVARAEAERRKTITRPARVYTNRDLLPVAPPAFLPETAADEHAAEDLGGSAADRDRGARAGSDARVRGDQGEDDEQAWRRRVAEARAALDRGRTIADALESRLNALSADFASRDDPAQRAVIATDRQKTRAELDRVRREIESSEAAIAKLEEDARRAGIPPGWLR